MAIYRDGKLVGAGGSIAPTVFTDGITLTVDPLLRFILRALALSQTLS